VRKGVAFRDAHEAVARAVRAAEAAGCDLAALVEELDGDMENDEPLAPYFTMFLAVVDGSRGLVRYVNAGHNTQFVVSPDGRVEQLPSTGRPPGLYPGGGYEERSAPLREGDALVLFTDGLVEAEDESGEPFGAGRLEALLRVHVAEGLSELLGHVHAAVRDHCGARDAADDATLVALRYSRGGQRDAAA
jgi:sigma-B regulation protein RsbU (phosphoserine phosphatase)